MGWSKVNAGQFVPPPLKTLVSATSGIASGVSSILQIIESILSVVSLFIVNVVDPQRAIVMALINEITSLILDLREHGVFILAVSPNHIEDKMSTEEHLSILSSAMVDPYDPNAPKISEFGSMYCVSLMIASPSGPDFANSMEYLGRVFNIQPFRDASDNFKKYAGLTIDDIPYPDPRGGEKPDFVAIRPEDVFPPLKVIFTELEKFSKLIQPGGRASDLMQDTLGAFSDKVRDLADSATAMSEALDTFVNDASQLGVYMLKGTVGGGTQGLASFIAQTGGAPEIQKGYFASITIIAPPAAAGALDLFF